MQAPKSELSSGTYNSNGVQSHDGLMMIASRYSRGLTDDATSSDKLAGSQAEVMQAALTSYDTDYQGDPGGRERTDTLNAGQSYCCMNEPNKCNCFHDQCSPVIQGSKVSMGATNQQSFNVCGPNDSQASSYPYQGHWNQTTDSVGYTRHGQNLTAVPYQTPGYYDHRLLPAPPSAPLIGYDKVAEDQDSSPATYHSGLGAVACHKNRAEGNYHELGRESSTKQDISMSLMAGGGSPQPNGATSRRHHQHRPEAKVSNSSKQQQQQIASSAGTLAQQQQAERDYHSFRSDKSQLSMNELYQPGVSTSIGEQYSTGGNGGCFVAVGSLIVHNHHHQEGPHLPGPFGDVRMNTNVSAGQQHNNAIIADQADHSHAYHTKDAHGQLSETSASSESQPATADQVPRQQQQQQQRQFNVDGNYYGLGPNEAQPTPADGVKQMNVIGGNADRGPPPQPPPSKQRHSIDAGKLSGSAIGADYENHLSSSASPSATTCYSSYANGTNDRGSAGGGTNQITTINWSLEGRRGPPAPEGAQQSGGNGGGGGPHSKSDQNNNHLKSPSSNEHLLSHYTQQESASLTAAAAATILLQQQPAQKQQLISMSNYHPASMKYEQSGSGVDESASVSFNQPHPALERHCVDGTSDYMLTQHQQHHNNHHQQQPQPTSQIMGPPAPSYAIPEQPHHSFASGYQQPNATSYIQSPAHHHHHHHHLHPVIY